MSEFLAPINYDRARDVLRRLSFYTHYTSDGAQTALDVLAQRYPRIFERMERKTLVNGALAVIFSPILGVALRKAGCAVSFGGAIGRDGRFLVDYMNELGVDTGCIEELDVPTGHAIIQVDEAGGNCIILFGGDVAGLDGLHLTLDELDPALAAGAVTGAGGIDGYIGPASQLQQIIALVTFDHNRVSTLNLEGYFHRFGSPFTNNLL